MQGILGPYNQDFGVSVGAIGMVFRDTSFPISPRTQNRLFRKIYRLPPLPPTSLSGRLVRGSNGFQISVWQKEALRHSSWPWLLAMALNQGSWPCLLAMALGHGTWPGLNIVAYLAHFRGLGPRLLGPRT